MDEIADLADRMLAKHRRGEAPDFEFAIEWGALTDEERDRYMALMDQRIAHGEEVLEAIQENVRILEELFRVWLRSDAPADMLLPEAIGRGYIGIQEVIDALRGAMTDPRRIVSSG
jgi:hypothetical protein